MLDGSLIGTFTELGTPNAINFFRIVPLDALAGTLTLSGATFSKHGPLTVRVAPDGTITGALMTMRQNTCYHGPISGQISGTQISFQLAACGGQVAFTGQGTLPNASGTFTDSSFPGETWSWTFAP